MNKEINEPKCPCCGNDDPMIDVNYCSKLEDDTVTYDWILRCPNCEEYFHYKEEYKLVKSFSYIKEE